MKASEHYDKAIELIDIAENYSRSNTASDRERTLMFVGLAQVHATLSLGEDRSEVTAEMQK